MRLLEIRDDPLAYFLPTKVTDRGTFFCAAPPGLAPELAELFMRPVHNGLPPKRRGGSPPGGPNKKPRLDGSVNGDDEVEQGRRAGSIAPSLGFGSDALGRGSLAPEGDLDFDNSGMIDDFQMDVGPDFDAGGELDLGAKVRSKSVGSTLSRMSTPALDGAIPEEGDETYADATCQIAMFDVRPSQTQGAEKETPVASNEGKGYSKNTVKALSIIRKELQPVADEEDEDKVLSFRKMSDKVSLYLMHLFNLLNILCRPLAVLPPRFSSSYLFLGPGIV